MLWFGLFFMSILNTRGWKYSTFGRFDLQSTALWGNKYERFSRNEEDPLEKTMRDVKERQAQNQPEVLRSTTVPVKESSPTKKKILQRRLESTTVSSSSKKSNSHSKQQHKDPLKSTAWLVSTSDNKIDLDEVVPSDAYTFGYLEIGCILGPHGIKGEVKVKVESDFAEARMKSGEILYVKHPNRRTPRPIEIASSRPQSNNTYLVKFKGILSRLGAQAFKYYGVYARKEERPRLGKDEYLIRDLVGAQCWTWRDQVGLGQQPSRLIGHVAGVVPPDELCSPRTRHFMHALLEICFLDSEELCLIPMVPKIVKEVVFNTDDRSENSSTRVIERIYIDAPGGLFDLRYTENKRVVIRGFLPVQATISQEERQELLSGQTRLLSLQGKS
jgi:16S rRNA processing protein RimM